MSKIMKTLPSRKNQEGFTLVELMIVVAIIGLLASVAIPNFKQYQAKTKTSEAKLQLAAIYSAETAFAGDYDTYSTCLSNMGYDPSTEAVARYFATGFAADVAGTIASAVLNGANSCVAGNFQFAAGKRVANVFAAATWVATANCGAVAFAAGPPPIAADATVTANGDAFSACAVGPVDARSITAVTASSWKINQNKLLSKVRDGY